MCAICSFASSNILLSLGAEMTQEIKSEKLDAMGTASIPKIVMQFSIPSIISMVVESLYNIVDRYFVGQMRMDPSAKRTVISLVSSIITLKVTWIR